VHGVLSKSPAQGGTSPAHGEASPGSRKNTEQPAKIETTSIPASTGGQPQQRDRLQRELIILRRQLDAKRREAAQTLRLKYQERGNADADSADDDSSAAGEQDCLALTGKSSNVPDKLQNEIRQLESLLESLEQQVLDDDDDEAGKDSDSVSEHDEFLTDLEERSAKWLQDMRRKMSVTGPGRV